MNVRRLDVHNNHLLIFTQRQALLEQVILESTPKFQLLAESDFEFDIERVSLHCHGYVLYGREKHHIFDPSSFETVELADIPSTSYYGGADIQITRLGMVIIGTERYALPSMPSKVIFTEEKAIIQCGHQIIVVGVEGGTEFAGVLGQANEGFIMGDGKVFDHEGVIEKLENEVVGLTREQVVFRKESTILECSGKEYQFEEYDIVELEFVTLLPDCFVCVVSPADLFINGEFVDELFTTRHIIEKYEFSKEQEVILTENQLAFTIKELPAEFEFYKNAATERDEFESWKVDEGCWLVKRQTMYRIERGEEVLGEVSGFQITRKECYGFIGNQVIFKSDGQYFICQLQMFPNGFQVRNDYIINEELVFAKNDDFSPRIAIKRSGDKYYGLMISELSPQAEFSIEETCELRSFHAGSTIYELSSTVFVVIPIERSEKLLFYEFIDNTVRLAESSFECEACEFFRENQLFVLLNEQLELLRFEDGDVFQHIFDNFQVESIFKDQYGDIVIGLVATYGFSESVYMKIKHIAESLFETDRKCILSVPVSKDTVLHCNDNCFGFYLGGRYTVIPIVDYTDVFDEKRLLGEVFEPEELERLLICRPLLRNKFQIECPEECCFCYSAETINLVECINEGGKAKLFIKQLRDETLYEVDYIDVCGTVSLVSPNKDGICVLLTNMQLQFYEFNKDQLQFEKMYDLGFYGLRGTEFKELFSRNEKVYIRCDIEGLELMIIVDDCGNVDSELVEPAESI